MLGILRIFFGAQGTRPWLVLGCLLFASFAEGLGVAALLPLLTVASGSDQAEPSLITEIITEGLQFVGLAPELHTLVILIVAALVLKAVVTLLAMTHVGYAMAHVATHLRTHLVKNLLRVRWGYFTSHPVGRFANTMSIDATRAGRTYLIAAEFLANSLQTVVYLIVALLMSWSLTLIAFGVGVGILSVLSFLVLIARRAGQKQTDRTRQLVTYLTDVLNNIKPLKAMAKQDVFGHLLDHKISGVRKALQKQIVSVETLKALQDISIALAMGIGFYVAVVLGNVATNTVVVMGLIILQVVKNMAKIQRYYQKVAILESPYYAISGLIEETAEAREAPHGGKRPTLEGEGCRFRNVSFGFGTKPVLRGLDLHVPVGELTVLSGASGTGKTSITDLLIGFYEPDEGEVLIDGVPLPDLDLAQWRRKVGYVSQDLNLLHDTVLNNITLGDPAVSEADAKAALEAVDAWAFVQSLPQGLATRVGEKGSQISGGQRQRIALARALAARPKLLILDEVTSALDGDTERELCDALRRLAADHTILAISHRPRLMEVADTVYHLAEGRVTSVERPGSAVAVGQEP